MITDNVKNADKYKSLGPRFQQAIDYIQHTDLAQLAAGRYELDGKNLYVLIQEYASKLPDAGKWEAHRNYVDLQYIVQGSERMGYAMLKRLQMGAYDPAKDFQALSGEGDFVTLQAGDFMLLWPDDGHMPGMAVAESTPVKKAVVKIALN